jgi:ADP-ribosylglycohydrolase
MAQTCSSVSYLRPTKTWRANARVLGSGLPWDEAARSYYQRNPNNSAGNGSPMRATPTAVRFAAASADETVDAARQTDRLAR